jgi:hypothetical protein
MIHATPKQPRLSFIKGLWQVMEEQIIYWEGFTFIIPVGYRCNLGSVPWLFQPIVRPTGRGNLGFLAHDFVYDDDAPLPVDGNGAEMSRMQGDEMMRDFLLFAGMAKWRADVAHHGVRAGGWFSFKKED